MSLTGARLAELAVLKDDWDSYGAKRPTRDALVMAGRLVQAVGGDPDITPINDGGLDVEWPSGYATTIWPDGSIHRPS